MNSSARSLRRLWFGTSWSESLQVRHHPRAFYWLDRVHRKANASLPVSSRSETGHERGRGPMGQVDDDRLRGIAGADRGAGVSLAR